LARWFFRRCHAYGPGSEFPARHSGRHR
jgi:hypothetical protein